MIASQNIKHGRAIHPVPRDRRKPRTTANQNGSVWMTWRHTRPVAPPTPATSARIIASEHAAITTGCVARASAKSSPSNPTGNGCDEPVEWIQEIGALPYEIVAGVFSPYVTKDFLPRSKKNIVMTNSK